MNTRMDNLDFAYLVTPFVAWLFAGTLKFIVNSVKVRRWAFDLIGYGGFPSTHSAIVNAMAFLVALREGTGHPSFGVALTLAFIVMLDAASLRKQVGKHAEAINKLSREQGLNPLRERIGHLKIEIAAGLLVGVGAAFAVDLVMRHL
jgi:acid phosphatase family membrane protein YuiD